MVVRTYKDLKFWQSSREVSLFVVKLVKKLPKERSAWVIIDQIIRSSFSVGANIAEGFGRYKGKEYPRFVSVALGSANETQYWLELLRDIYPGFGPDIEVILLKNLETIKMLTATLRSLRQR